MPRRLRLGLAVFLAASALTGLALAMLPQAAGGNAKQIRLGGDIEICQPGEPLPLGPLTYFSFHDVVFSPGIELHALARSVSGKEVRIFLKGVGRHYPLYGKLEFQEKAKGRAFFKTRNRSSFGVAVNRPLLDALGVKLGDSFIVGRTNYKIQAVLKNAPGDAAEPMAIVSLAAAHATRLIKTSGDAIFCYRLKLPEGASLDAWEHDFAGQFPDSNSTVRDWRSLR